MRGREDGERREKEQMVVEGCNLPSADPKCLQLRLDQAEAKIPDLRLVSHTDDRILRSWAIICCLLGTQQEAGQDVEELGIESAL